MTKRDIADTVQPDAFDNPPQGPAGVHRGNRPLGVRVTPFIIVVLLAALAGVGAWAVFTGEIGQVRWPWSSVQAESGNQSGTGADAKDTTDDGTGSDDANADANAGDANTDTPSGEDSNATGGETEPNADPNATETPQSTPTVNKATTVRVVNGTRIQGYAASKAGVLSGAGYTSVEAKNPTGSLPTQTVVWYANEADQATAADVAATLGITAVERVDGIAQPIVVVLMS